MIDFITFCINNPGIALLLLLALILWFFTEFGYDFLLHPPKKKKKPTPNNLKYAPRFEAQGFIFGRLLKFGRPSNTVCYSPVDDEGHILIVGGSGTGKTSSLIRPSLNSWTGTSYTIDISGDIHSKVTLPNKLIYEPNDPNSVPYNIFGVIDSISNEGQKYKALTELAYLILPDDPTAQEAAKYYNEQARNILKAALTAFYFDGKDFVEICNIIISNNWRNLLNLIDETENDIASSYLNGFEGVSEQYTANAKQNCDNALSIFVTDLNLKKNVRRPNKGEICFEPSIIETHNCFLVIPDEDLEYFGPLISVITAQILDYFKSRTMDYNHKIALVIDEATSMSIDLLPCVQKYRKRGVRLICAIQSLSSIDYFWGNNNSTYRSSLLANFKYKLLLESAEPTEQKYWADLIGHSIQKNLSITSGKSTKTSYTESDHKDYIIEPSELANLGKELILLYPGGYKQLYKNFDFE